MADFGGSEILSSFPKNPALEQDEFSGPAKYPPRRCACSLGTGHCDPDGTCLSQPDGACFYSIEYQRDGWGAWQRDAGYHQFGCLARGGGTDLQCKGHLATHHTPKTIRCCFDGPMCNWKGDFEPPPARMVDEPWAWVGSRNGILLLSAMGLTLSLCLLLALCAYVRLCRGPKRRKSFLKRLHQDLGAKGVEGEDWEGGGEEAETASLMSSGSGSRHPKLVQRTMRLNLVIKEIIGKGRYGEVQCAEYRGDLVAVKVSSPHEEAAWSNETAVYQIPLRHPAILGYRNGDIGSMDSQTRLYLVTDYHALGSLYDQLSRAEPLSGLEAVQLLHSTAAGLTYLHMDEAGRSHKPKIAHRDIKSKNILVKARGVCCIADFGLALTATEHRAGRGRKSQVGTKRYMAPELLSEEVKASDFDAFLQADIYAFALVVWEVTRRVQHDAPSEPELLLAAHAARLPLSGLIQDSLSSGVSSLSSSGGNYSVPPRPPPAQTMATMAVEDSGFSSQSASSGASHLGPAPPPLQPLLPPAKAYSPPYAEAGQDPSIEAMRDLVCPPRSQRPEIEPHWRRLAPLAQLSTLMEACWTARPEARLPAMRLRMDLQEKVLPLAQAQSQAQTTAQRPATLPRHSPVPPSLTQIPEQSSNAALTPRLD